MEIIQLRVGRRQGYDRATELLWVHVLLYREEQEEMQVRDVAILVVPLPFLLLLPLQRRCSQVETQST